MRIRQLFDIEFDVHPDGPTDTAHAECVAGFSEVLRIFQRESVSVSEDGRRILINRFRAADGQPEEWPEDS